MSTSQESAPALEGRCRNCEALAPGHYCPDCGQETATHPPSALEFLHEFIGHYVALEGALWRSLRALAIPGRLTLEYYAGRRRTYVLPLRLYLTASVVFFLALKIAGPHPPLQVNLLLPDMTVTGQTVPAVPCKFESAFCTWTNTRVEARYGKLTRAEWNSIREQHALQVFPYAMFLLVPVFALVTRLVFAGYGRNYGEHLVFALHTHAAAFFWGTLMAPFGNLILLSGPACGYAAVAMVQVFRGPRLAAIVRTFASLILYGCAFVAAVLTIVVAAAFL